MTPTLLHLETATEVCSVALSIGDEVIASVHSDKGNSHTEHLFPFIEHLLEESRCSIADIDGVVVSMGPGSYTGLRIGTSAAKGICYALNIPIIGVSTLQSIAFGAKNAQKDEQTIMYCPMIDARRMEIFTALFDDNGESVTSVTNMIVDENSFVSELNQKIICFCGNGLPKCQPFLRHPNARFHNAPAAAQHMLVPALAKYEKRQFDSIAYFEPFYLKEFLAKKSTVKGLAFPNNKQ